MHCNTATYKLNLSAGDFFVGFFFFLPYRQQSNDVLIKNTKFKEGLNHSVKPAADSVFFFELPCEKQV